MKTFLISSLLALSFFPEFFAKHHEILHLPGKDEAGKGKSVVLVAGDEEYRTEEKHAHARRDSFSKTWVRMQGFCFCRTRPANAWMIKTIRRGEGWHHPEGCRFDDHRYPLPQTDCRDEAKRSDRLSECG